MPKKPAPKDKKKRKKIADLPAKSVGADKARSVKGGVTLTTTDLKFLKIDSAIKIDSALKIAPDSMVKI